MPDFVLHTKVPKPSNLHGVHLKNWQFSLPHSQQPTNTL